MKKKANTTTDFVKLVGSNKKAPEASKLETLNPNESIEITIRVRRNKSIESALKAGKRFTHEQYEKEFGSTKEDIEKVELFADEHHLTLVESDAARRSVIVKGKIADFEKAFQLHLSNYRNDKGTIFRGRTGVLHIPSELKDIIEGVFGLDNRPVARPMFRQVHKGNFSSRVATFEGYNPTDVSKAYKFPTDATGKNQCIGIIELGGGFRNTDLTTYFDTLGIEKPIVKAISVDGAHNSPSTADSDDGEVVLDIQVAGAVANGATIAVYFAPNTDKGFLDAITKSIHDVKNKPSVISISWGAAEVNWTEQFLNNFNEAFKAASLLGITVCAASGDHGSSDAVSDNNVHVDFPASSPYVLACGGTRLEIKNKTVKSETVWHEADSWASGGGISEFFALPDYQQTAKIPLSINTKFKGRGVPDIAGNASGDTGYKVLVDGVWSVTGGTSAVAPLMAAFIALMNEKNKITAGFIHPKIYSKPSQYCRDITKGDNITAGSKGFKAAKGWDACTGLGVLSKL